MTTTETVTETVTADQLSIGDRVLAFGLEWLVVLGPDEVFRLSSLDWYGPGIELHNRNRQASFERIIPPKRYKRTEVLEYRLPKTGEQYRAKPHDSRLVTRLTGTDGKDQYVITSVEVEELP